MTKIEICKNYQEKDVSIRDSHTGKSEVIRMPICENRKIQKVNFNTASQGMAAHVLIQLSSV